MLLPNTDNLRLRINLRLTDVPELADIPWEILHDGHDFLTLYDQRTLVRYLELPQPIKPLSVPPPLRALVVLSTPKDNEQLDTAREWRLLNEALADVISTGLFEIEWLDPPTITNLQKQLHKNKYHILHFSGHGEFNASAPEEYQSALIFEDEFGRGDRVTALDLARLVRAHPFMRLVVLNACEGARASTRNAFTGVGQTVIRNGIPAVIAMQFPFTDEAAHRFASTFYGALADRYPIDAALGEARLALSRVPIWEWVTPVIFTRVADGKLFDLDLPDEKTVQALKHAATLRVAREAFARGHWDLAEHYASQLLQLYPGDSEARTLRDKSRRELETAQFYWEGISHMSANSWRKAAASFREVQKRNPLYRDTSERIREIKRHLEMQETSTTILKNTADENADHYNRIVDALLQGKLTLFFGQGINEYGRELDSWERESAAPSGEELARYLATKYQYDQDDKSDLLRVSQFVVFKENVGELLDALCNVYSTPSQPTALHRFWAKVTAQMHASNGHTPYPILITANYDTLLEKAFEEEDEPYDSLVYLTQGDYSGKFLHRPHNGTEQIVKDPTSYDNMHLDKYATIVRVHGAVPRTNSENPNFVITEDDYLNFFRTEVENMLPRRIIEQLKGSYWLFMGVNLRNWNLRGLLYRMAYLRKRPWLVQPRIRGNDNRFWRTLDVNVLDISYETFLNELATRINTAASEKMT